MIEFDEEESIFDDQGLSLIASFCGPEVAEKLKYKRECDAGVDTVRARNDSEHYAVRAELDRAFCVPCGTFEDECCQKETGPDVSSASA